jgi:HTH-type transcriptional regulator/antitoxin HigA
MQTKTRGRTLPGSYFKLVKEFPLVQIRDDMHATAAQAMIDRLLAEDLDRGSEAYLNVLTDLFEAYEGQSEDIADASEADVLRELIRANGLTQPKLATKVGIAQSTISAVLNGARSLTKGQILKLSAFFNVSPDAFLPRVV